METFHSLYRAIHQLHNHCYFSLWMWCLTLTRVFGNVLFHLLTAQLSNTSRIMLQKAQCIFNMLKLVLTCIFHTPCTIYIIQSVLQDIRQLWYLPVSQNTVLLPNFSLGSCSVLFFSDYVISMFAFISCILKLIWPAILCIICINKIHFIIKQSAMQNKLTANLK